MFFFGDYLEFFCRYGFGFLGNVLGPRHILKLPTTVYGIVFYITIGELINSVQSKKPNQSRETRTAMFERVFGLISLVAEISFFYRILLFQHLQITLATLRYTRGSLSFASSP